MTDGGPSPDVTCSEQTDVRHPIEKALVKALGSKRAALPVLPTVATAAIELASDPDTDVQELARLIDRDPPIAARFMSVANSAAFWRGWAASSTHAAIVRLGLATTRDLIFQVVYASSTAGLKRYQSAVQASFSRSVLSGIAARNVARTTGEGYEYAYMSGLLHNIGEGRILRILSDLPNPVEGMPLVETLVDRYHAAAGAEIAMQWRLPAVLVEVCVAHHDSSSVNIPHIRLVMIADAVVDAIHGGGKYVLGPDFDRFASLGIDEATATAIIARTREEEESLGGQ